jgi:SAM-dependent methyltransferase
MIEVPAKPKWPKQLLELTPEQLKIKDDFMKYWHEVLPRRFGLIERFNHGYPARAAQRKGRVLEIGAGLGEHIAYEELDGNEYYAVELRPDMAQRIRERFPQVRTITGDCQQGLPIPDGHFDRVLAIHVLEHLPDLPSALSEIHRLLKPDGQFCVVLPCEGGLAYSVARRISAKPLFEKRYKTSYDWFIKTEHINDPHEIIAELLKRFVIRSRSFFPFRIPSIELNLVFGMVLAPLPFPARNGDSTL